MKIEIMGTGCPKCETAQRNVEAAVRELGIEAQIVKVDQVADIVARGVMMTPAVAVDERIIASGRVPTVEEIKRQLQEA